MGEVDFSSFPAELQKTILKGLFFSLFDARMLYQNKQSNAEAVHHISSLKWLGNTRELR